MASELPVPIEFRLPEAWRPAEPDVVGAPTAAYVALRPEPAGEFVANVTVSGELDTADRSLVGYADESLERLRRTAPDVQLTMRSEVGSEHVPGLTQIVTLSTDVHGTQRDIVQVHVFLSLPDSQQPERRAIIELVLSSVPEEVDQVVGDFRDFVGSVAPHHGELTGAD